MRFRFAVILMGLAVAACTSGTDANTDVSISATAGNQQTGVTGTPLAVPLSVKAVDALGAPLSGIIFDWSVQSGGGSVNPTTSTTNVNGVATTTLTLGTTVGAQTVKAAQRGSSASVLFTATAELPIAVRILQGNNQVGTAGQPLNTMLRVQVLENGLAVAPGRVVQWSSTSGGVTLSGATSTTDIGGVANMTATLGPTPGVQTVTATLQGTASSTVFTLNAFALSSTPVLAATVPVPANYGHHDTFVRDGIAFVMAWNTGVLIYDVGNGIRDGSPINPVLVSSIIPNTNGVSGGAQAHNAWWFHNPVTGQKKYLFVGQEGPGVVPGASSGDIHVIDVSNLAAPVEVASLRVPNAGAHNFWMDEQRQVLYSAYYNGGVIAVDVSGTLTGDISSRITAQVRPGGIGNTYIWGVMLANGTLYATDMVSGFWALDPVTLATRGGGNNVPERYGSDQWIHGPWAYSGTWGGQPRSGRAGNAIKVWSLSAPGGNPVLADSIIVPNIATVSDVAVTPDGKVLVATAEGGSGGAGLYVFDRVDPKRPALRGFVSVPTGVHTGEIAVINGRTYVFAAKDPGSPALLIYDITGVVP